MHKILLLIKHGLSLHIGVRDLTGEEYPSFVLEIDTNSIGDLLGVIEEYKPTRGSKRVRNHSGDRKDKSCVGCRSFWRER